MNATYLDRAAYLPGVDVLVLADLHVGRDATSNVDLPLGERADLVERLGDALATVEPARVVFAGDVLHAFDSVPAGAVDSLGRLFETVSTAGATLELVAGNHDSMLERVADEVADEDGTVAVRDELELDDGTVVCHGHEAPETDAERYVIGHDHPAIRIEGRRQPCFLLGRGAYRDADVLVLPAFSRLAAGTLVNGRRRGDYDSPLLDDLYGFEPIVRAGEDHLTFPELGKLRGVL